MALPQDGQNANGLTKVTEIPKGKELIFIDPITNEGGIITLEDLTTQILKNLTSQTFALDQGTKTLPAALNELNSKAVSTYDMGNYYNDYTFTKFLQEKQGTGITILSGYTGYLFSDLPTDLSDAVNVITYKGNNQKSGIYSQGFISDSLGHRYTFVADTSFSNVTFNKF